MYQSLGPVKVVSGENLAGGCQEVRLLQKGLQVVPAATSRRKDNIQHKPLRANKSEVGLASLFPTQKECYKVCSQTFVSQRNKSMAHPGFETHIIVLPTYCNTERFRLRKGGGDVMRSKHLPILDKLKWIWKTLIIIQSQRLSHLQWNTCL